VCFRLLADVGHRITVVLLSGYLVNCSYYIENENIFVLQCFATAGTMDWIGLDWVNQLVDWVGLDLAKWTHAQLWFSLNICFGRRFIVVFILIYTFHDVAKYCHSFIHSFIHSTRRHQHDSKRTGIND